MGRRSVMGRNRGLVVAFGIALAFSVGAARASHAYTSEGKNASGEAIKLDVPYVPTPQRVVNRMLELAAVKRGDVVYDLGSGDGRIVVTAAKKYGAKGVGVDLDPQRVKEARENVKSSGVEKMVTIREGNALKTDVSEADVVTLYLLPSVNLALKERLQRLPPGTRIVSHNYDMGDWRPLKEETMMIDGTEHFIYYWKVGARERRHAVR